MHITNNLHLECSVTCACAPLRFQPTSNLLCLVATPPESNYLLQLLLKLLSTAPPGTCVSTYTVQKTPPDPSAFMRDSHSASISSKPVAFREPKKLLMQHMESFLNPSSL
ncbi:hypothetical protein DY000_02040625 [Brassica cretica]|uniref:Uncharacterized protein n=1 Tax=Brassica cretica TaxID=69181 RepID=A0ABQ7BR15_BRACR|nr:hypothetical protein DY000_02040625 [Brassica cretica]